jgi:hypothetical protein
MLIFVFQKSLCLQSLMVFHPFHLGISYHSILVLTLHLSLATITLAPSPIGRGEPLRYVRRGAFGVVYSLRHLYTLLS